MIQFYMQTEDEAESEVSPSLRKLVEQMVAAEPRLAQHNINIILTDDENIAKMHGDFLGDSAVTDVISFNLGTENDPDPLPDELAEEDIWGEVYVNTEQAERQSGEQGHGINREIAMLAVHGLLHLAGWDDETEEQRSAMITEGERIIKAFEDINGVFGS